MRSSTLLLALALAACSKSEPPTITPEAIQLLRISPAGAELEATLDAWNPNDEDLTASSLSTTVTLGGKPDVARAIVVKPLELPAKQRQRVVVPISVEWADKAALLALAEANQDAQYHVEGSVEFEGKRGVVKAPFRIEGRMTPAELKQATTAAPPPAPPPPVSASASASAKPPRPPRR